MGEKTSKERSGRLVEIGKMLEKLPQEVRQEAFQLLKGYVTEQKSDAGHTGKPPHRMI